jgi:hypothetical protein
MHISQHCKYLFAFVKSLQLSNDDDHNGYFKLHTPFSWWNLLEFWSPGLGHEDQTCLLQCPDRGRPKFVGSGPHHTAPYIRHSWHMNQGSSVNSILSEGPDLLGAEVVGCPTISPSPSTSTPGSTPLPAPHLVQVCLQAPRCVSIPLSQIKLQLKTIHWIPKATPYWFKP